MYTQQELDAKLLAAANALRGPIDAADFKAYIFPLLFLKRISDTWHWEHSRALELFDGDEDLAGLPDNYRFVVPDGCRWESVLALHENVGAGVQLVFDRLQEANPETLAGVFGTAQWANKAVLPEGRLTAVIDVFTSLKLDPGSVTHDLLGNAYEYLLKNFADESGKKAGEFFTPRAVVRLMVRLLDPQEGESIYDPACGSGGMLVEAVNQVRAQGRDPRTLRLYGQEVQATTAAIARMNLYIHDIETFAVRRGDTLRDPRFRESDGSLSRFDAVIANPPFSLRNWGRDVWADDPFGRADYGVPPDGYGDFAFVEHMVASMARETGRLAVVMPHGILFRKGAEGAIRRNLLRAGVIETVIALPPNLFYNTAIPACLLVCRSPRTESTELPVRFVDATACFTRGTNQNEMAPADVEAVVAAYRTSESADATAVSDVPFAEIAGNDYELGIGLYLGETLVEEFDLQAAVVELAEARQHLVEADGALARVLGDLGYV